jgi:hypothetical protein
LNGNEPSNNNLKKENTLSMFNLAFVLEKRTGPQKLRAVMDVLVGAFGRIVTRANNRENNNTKSKENKYELHRFTSKL